MNLLYLLIDFFRFFSIGDKHKTPPVLTTYIETKLFKTLTCLNLSNFSSPLVPHWSELCIRLMRNSYWVPVPLTVRPVDSSDQQQLWLMAMVWLYLKLMFVFFFFLWSDWPTWSWRNFMFKKLEALLEQKSSVFYADMNGEKSHCTTSTYMH